MKDSLCSYFQRFFALLKPHKQWLYIDEIMSGRSQIALDDITTEDTTTIETQEHRPVRAIELHRRHKNFSRLASENSANLNRRTNLSIL